MALASLIIAAEAVLFKYIFISVNWATGLTGVVLFGFIFAVLMFLHERWRTEIVASYCIFKQSWRIFGSEELLTFTGTAALTYAIALAKVGLVEAVGALQPLFVLGYALAFRRFFPRV